MTDDEAENLTDEAGLQVMHDLLVESDKLGDAEFETWVNVMLLHPAQEGWLRICRPYRYKRLATRN